MKRVWTALTLAAALIVTIGLAGCEEHYPPKGDVAALVLVDMQTDFLNANGRLPVAQGEVAPMIEAANAMIGAARTDALPVVYIRDEASPFAISTLFRNGAAPRLWAGSEIDPRLDAWAGPYFNKDNDPSAFANDHLNPFFMTHNYLLQNVGHLFVAGVYASGSVLATSRAARARGYQVTVLSDAVADASDAAREQALSKLRAAGVQIATSADFVTAFGTSKATD